MSTTISRVSVGAVALLAATALVACLGGGSSESEEVAHDAGAAPSSQLPVRTSVDAGATAVTLITPVTTTTDAAPNGSAVFAMLGYDPDATCAFTAGGVRFTGAELSAQAYVTTDDDGGTVYVFECDAVSADGQAYGSLTGTFGASASLTLDANGQTYAWTTAAVDGADAAAAIGAPLDLSFSSPTLTIENADAGAVEVTDGQMHTILAAYRLHAPQ